MSQNNKNYPYQYQPVPQQFPVTQQLYPSLPQVVAQPMAQQQQMPVFQQMPVQQQQQQPVRVVLMPQQVQQQQQRPQSVVTEQPKACCNRNNNATCQGKKCRRGCRLCCSGCCCGMFFVLLLIMIFSFPAISHLLAIKGHFDRCMNPDFSTYDYQTFAADNINTINVEFTSIPGRVIIQPQYVYTTAYGDDQYLESQPSPAVGQPINSDNVISVSTTSRYNLDFDASNFASNLVVDENGVLNLNYLYNGHFWKKSCPRFDVVITVPSKVFDLINVKSNVGYTTIQDINSKQINVTSEIGLIEVSTSTAETIDTRVNAIGAVRINGNQVSSTIHSAVTVGRIQVSSFSGSVQTETHVGVTRIEVDESFAGSISLQTDIGGTGVRGFENVQYSVTDNTEVSEPVMMDEAFTLNNKRHRKPHPGRPHHPRPEDPNMPDQPNPDMPPQDPNMPNQPNPDMPQDPNMPDQPNPNMPEQPQEPNMPYPGEPDYNGHTDCGKRRRNFAKQIETVINGGGDRSVVASTMIGCIKVKNASYHPWGSSSSSSGSSGSSSSSSSGGSSSSSSGNDKVVEPTIDV